MGRWSLEEELSSFLAPPRTECIRNFLCDLDYQGSSNSGSTQDT